MDRLLVWRDTKMGKISVFCHTVSKFILMRCQEVCLVHRIFPITTWFVSWLRKGVYILTLLIRQPQISGFLKHSKILTLDHPAMTFWYQPTNICFRLLKENCLQKRHAGMSSKKQQNPNIKAERILSKHAVRLHMYSVSFPGWSHYCNNGA